MIMLKFLKWSAGMSSNTANWDAEKETLAHRVSPALERLSDMSSMG